MKLKVCNLVGASELNNYGSRVSGLGLRVIMRIRISRFEGCRGLASRVLGFWGFRISGFRV